MRQAIRLSEGLAVCWILRNFRDLNLQGVVNDIVEVLRQCLIVMLTTTGGAALIGGIAGGVGTGAGAQVGEWILIAMGLKALAEYVVNDMPGIAATTGPASARPGWPPPRHPATAAATTGPRRPARRPPRRREDRPRHVAVLVLLPMGIVAYLAKGRGSMGELAESMSWAGGRHTGQRYPDDECVQQRFRRYGGRSVIDRDGAVCSVRKALTLLNARMPRNARLRCLYSRQPAAHPHAGRTGASLPANHTGT
ncbi:DUF6861 domain-containing protein [Rhodanobacter denitrificans]|uniref:DUF6861 domain-containing protein n=1 Tax=Rhodanobacter denitrificans TaxID=666685 RepID=UPI000B0257D5